MTFGDRVIILWGPIVRTIDLEVTAANHEEKRHLLKYFEYIFINNNKIYTFFDLIKILAGNGVYSIYQTIL